MSKKTNNLVLLYIIAGLLILFGIVKWYQKNRAEHTLKSELVKLDTARVNEIDIFPLSENREEIKFYKEGNEWKIKKGNIIAEPDPSVVKNLLTTLNDMKVKNLVATDRKKWKDYNVTDTSATRVKVIENKRVKLNLLIGRFSYQQNQSPYAMYGGGGVTGTTYVRKENENEVYGVDGFLVFTFNQQFNNFRKQTIGKFETNAIERIKFNYPADSSFVVELKNKKWEIGQEIVDSAKVVSYLNQMSYKNSSNFNDNFSLKGMPQYQVTFEGKDIKPIIIDAYSIAPDSFIINSNLNPKSFFASNVSGLFKEIFVSRKLFLPDNNTKKEKKLKK